MATDEEIAEKREQLEELRAQIAQNEAERSRMEHETANDITLRQLEAEEARLRARLAEQNATAKQATTGARSPLAAADAELERATELHKAVEASVNARAEAAGGEDAKTSTPVTGPAAPLLATPTTTQQKGK